MTTPAAKKIALESCLYRSLDLKSYKIKYVYKINLLGL